MTKYKVVHTRGCLYFIIFLHKEWKNVHVEVKTADCKQKVKYIQVSSSFSCHFEMQWTQPQLLHSLLQTSRVQNKNSETKLCCFVFFCFCHHLERKKIKSPHTTCRGETDTLNWELSQKTNLEGNLQSVTSTQAFVFHVFMFCSSALLFFIWKKNIIINPYMQVHIFRLTLFCMSVVSSAYKSAKLSSKLSLLRVGSCQDGSRRMKGCFLLCSKRQNCWINTYINTPVVCYTRF